MTDKQNLFCLIQHVIDTGLGAPNTTNNYELARLYDLVQSLQSDYPDFTPDKKKGEKNHGQD